MNTLTAILIGAISLGTTHDEIPDGTTVGEILGIGGYNATNAAEYVVAKYDETNLSARINAKYTKPANGIPMSDLKSDLQNTIYGKQDALASGVNIKTLNNQSILGAGNMTVTAVAPIEKIYTNGSEVVVGQDRIARIVFPTGGGGSGGIDTNAVRSIVNAEVGGTNTLVHSDDLIATTNAMEAAGTDSQIMRAKLLDDSISLWDIYSSRSASADKAYNIDDYYWTDGTHPTTLEGYGITDALSSSGGWTLNGSASFGGYVYLMEGWNYLRSTAGDTQTLPEYLTSGAWNTKTDTNKFLTVGGALAASDLWSESNANLTGTVGRVSAPIATNAAEAVVANANTTYASFAQVTNVNQSIQSVDVASGGSLTILAPTAAVKDWVVYANCAADNTPLTLPSGQYYATDEAYTNALKAGVTAIYFTSCKDGIAIGRQELKPITIP